MKAERKHKKAVSITLYIIVLLLLLIGGTYAIVQNISYNTENVVASLGSRPVFTSTSTNSIVMEDIPYIPEVSTEEYEIDNATEDITVTLSTNYDVRTICTYDIVWEWDTDADQYTKTTGATKEFTVSGVSSDGKRFNEVQLNNYNDSNLKTVLASDMSIDAASGVMSTQTWTFTIHFYKTEAIQSAHQGKSYPGKIYVDNVIC